MFSFRVKYALQVLAELERAKITGRQLSATELRSQCGFDPQGLTTVLGQLRRKNMVYYNKSRYRYSQSVDLTCLTLYDLVIAMDEGILMGRCAVEGWPVKNRHKHNRSIDLDREFTAELEYRFRNICLCELIGQYLPQLN